MCLGIQYRPTLNISEKHGNYNITITVKWAPVLQVKNVIYSTTISPSVKIMHTGNTSRQFTIPYDMEYNFSVVATTPCRPNATASITLHYGEAK